MTSALNAALKGAGIGAIAACILGCTAYAIRGDRYSVSHFLTTLSGLTLVSGIAAAVAVTTQELTYDQGYSAALKDLETKLNQPAAKPTLMAQNGEQISLT